MAGRGGRLVASKSRNESRGAGRKNARAANGGVVCLDKNGPAQNKVNPATAI